MQKVDWSPAATRAAINAAQEFSDKARGKWSRPPEMIDDIREISEARTLHIFNVGPWDHWARLGSWGDFFIPKKPEDKRYSFACSIPAVYQENMVDGDGVLKAETIPGMRVAQNIIGEGDLLQGARIIDSKGREGVFIGSVRGPDGLIPTDEDIKRAERRLQDRYKELVAEANEAQSQGGHAVFLRVGAKHHLAARMIGRNDLKWMQDRSPEVNNACPGCGAGTPETAMKCACGYIVKPQEFWAAVQEGRMFPPAGVEVPEIYRLAVKATAKPQEQRKA